MRVLVDSTVPADDDGLLYLRIVKVPAEFLCDVVTNDFGNNSLHFDHDDIEEEFETEATFVVDPSFNTAELVARADEKAVAKYTDRDGDVDDWAVAVNQILLDLVNVSGCAGIYWVFE